MSSSLAGDLSIDEDCDLDPIRGPEYYFPTNLGREISPLDLDSDDEPPSKGSASWAIDSACEALGTAIGALLAHGISQAEIRRLSETCMAAILPLVRPKREPR